jgi:hypothetical protein
LLAGCALQHGKYYYPDGQLCAHTLEVVVGTGETETVTDAECVVLLHSTSDTGFSEQVPKIAESVAKGAVKGIVPTP